MPETYMFSPAAYGKLLLHAFKHPSQAVSGLLVGKVDAKVLYVHEAVPLFHTYSQLMPMLEVALKQVNAIFEKDGMFVLGLYSSSQPITDKATATPHSEKIVKRIADGSASTCAVLVQLVNSSFKPSCRDIALKIYSASDMTKAVSGSIKLGYLYDGLTTEIADKESVSERLCELLKQQKVDLVVDFESHLDNVKNDYMNPELSLLLSEGIVPSN
ncbi:ER membrane protein complex subunit 8/9 [Diplonema papillatum]|nr:ER membrane protein complex subunit 8/9 [Diplonema papillatum]